MDDGKFRLRTFGKVTRDKETIQREEIEFNNVMWFDDYTMPIDEFPDPFITCCFIDDDNIFVNFFYAHTQTHYHFIWDTKRRQAQAPHGSEGVSSPSKKNQKKKNQPTRNAPKNVVTRKLQCTIKNFPWKCFYN